mgnify:CR=1 FL=1
MAKVTLVRPPSIVSAGTTSGFLTPPIGLAYLGAFLRNAGHKVTIVDALGLDAGKSTYLGNQLILRGISFSDILNLIPKDTDLIGFSGMFSTDWVSLKPLVNMIGEKFRKTYFIAGGEHFTAVPEICLKQCEDLDAISLGEGEETLTELANAIDSNSSWFNIAGLVIRDNDKFIKTNNRKRLIKLDEIPKPAWDLVPINNYLDLSLSFGVERGRTMPMLASRGCPFQCTFCSSPYMWGTRWLARDPKLVADEIEEYIEKYNVNNIDFYDLTAIVKKSWIIEFCNELISRNLNITWQLPSGTRSEAIDDEVVPLLYKSGCKNMTYAPESGSEKTLVLIKKKVKLARMLKSLRSAVKIGINVKINIIIGFPGETHKDILKTFWYILKFSFAGAHDVSVMVFAPYPGSELYDDLIKKGVINHDNEYWQQLSFVDITKTKSYCENISSKSLLFYNWSGMILFYLSNYAFRPVRVYKTLRNLIIKKHESRGEDVLAQIIKRCSFTFKASKKSVN